MDPSVAARRFLEEIGAPDDEDIVVLALKKLGIEVIRGMADSIDAMLIHVPPGRPVIAVNFKPSAVSEEVFRGTRTRALRLGTQLPRVFRKRRGRHDKARPEAGAGGQCICRGVPDAQSNAFT